MADTLGRLTKRATDLGLYLAHYNTGRAGNVLNGFRVFRGTEPKDFFNGGELAHLRSSKEIDVWLTNYAATEKGPVP